MSSYDKDIVHITDPQDLSRRFKEKVIIHKCSCGKVLEIRIKEVDE